MQKLEDALEDLRQGNSNYYSITKLTSMKSLCRDEDYRKQYCVYLASLVMDNAKIHAEKDNVEKIIKLIQEAYLVIENVARDGSNTNIIVAKATLSQLKDFQDQYKRVKWATVRIINSTELLILENILQCLLSQTDIAASYAYDATRNYVEKYNPHYGTGLIPDSIPMLENIICFWNRYKDR
ncbi:MAG: hypothetical protein WCA32_11855 [Chromatiaceae bacterium]